MCTIKAVAMRVIWRRVEGVLWRAFFPSTDGETALFGTQLIDETNGSMPVLLVQPGVVAHRYT